MKRKIARGSVRKILVRVGEIQNIVGRAEGVYQNDRATDRSDTLNSLLRKAFSLCVDILGEYEQINSKPAPATGEGSEK